MCGLFGYIGDKTFDPTYLRACAVLAQRRGMHSFGYILDGICLKYPGLVSKNLDLLPKSGNLLVGHCRLATTGSSDNINDYQPFLDNGLGIVHNGNIYNYREIQEDFNLKLKSSCDSEILLRLIELQPNIEGIKKTLDIIDKSPGAFVFCMGGFVVLARRKLPLWITKRDEGLYFCSLKVDENSEKITDNTAVVYSPTSQITSFTI